MDIVNDDCSDIMFSLLGLGMSGIQIRRHILGNVFYSTFTNVFKIIITFFLFERLLHR